MPQTDVNLSSFTYRPRGSPPISDQPDDHPPRLRAEVTASSSAQAEQPVKALGEFGSADPAPTREQFKAYVDQVRIH
ncbi:hypothetical protein EAH80_21185 [Mycobacterium hodleri]|uniref:Uncharacterized protein n=1 Tax=Mycolicibacterium hodleri TaxID=49897 RepID=A0A502E268_9MYCO|nr:hypothetical protein EAH80_21185 [Mycolicibacterium hodleri]